MAKVEPVKVAAYGPFDVLRYGSSYIVRGPMGDLITASTVVYAKMQAERYALAYQLGREHERKLHDRVEEP